MGRLSDSPGGGNLLGGSHRAFETIVAIDRSHALRGELHDQPMDAALRLGRKSHPRILAALTAPGVAARYHLASLHERLTPSVLQGALRRHPFAQGSAYELGRRSGGKRNQGRT